MILSVLLKYWKEVLIIALSIFCLLSVKSCQNHRDDSRSLSNSLSITKKEIKTYKDKNGKLISQVENHELTIDQLKDNAFALGIENDEMKDQIGNLNRLVGYWKVKAEASGSNSSSATDTVFVYRDREITGKRFFYSNGFLTLDELYNPVSDSIFRLYSYNVLFDLIAYRKDKSLFRKGTLVADIKFHDPNVVVREFQGIVIREERKKWFETKGFQIGLGFLAGWTLRGR